MGHYWQECLRLPQRIQEWDAFKEMREAIHHYLEGFPILHKLNSKVIHQLLLCMHVFRDVHICITKQRIGTMFEEIHLV